MKTPAPGKSADAASVHPFLEFDLDQSVLICWLLLIFLIMACAKEPVIITFLARIGQEAPT